MKYLRTLILASIPFFVAACASGPDYTRPDVSQLVPTDWRWKLAEPQDVAPKGEWWTVFDDETLNKLEADALADSPTLQAAMAKVEQARAVARISRSQLFPNVSVNAYAQRQRLSGNRPMQIETAMPIEPMYMNTFSASLDAAYELDFWGRVKRDNESSRSLAEASVADSESVRLTLAADVAVNYFAIRAKDIEISSLKRAVELRAESAKILSERFASGLIPEIDASQAKTELAQSKADLAGVERERAELFNALALLCGKTPAQFELSSTDTPLAENPVVVPVTLPATLLERRPDIAAAERRLVSRNAQIGVARAAYFPTVSLVGSGGVLSSDADNLFSADSAAWSLAPKVSIPLFNAGRTKADVSRAKAAYEEAVANYRQSVLVAFKDVEDALAGISFLAEQDKAQNDALAFARQTADLATARYKAGYVDYMTVANTERNVLAQERQSAKIKAQRYAASIRLIKALGGNWEK